jgi:hypothetical protein
VSSVEGAAAVQSHRDGFAERKAQLVARSGEWVAHNIVLPSGYTISPGVAGDHYRLRRILQLIADCQGRSFPELRVVDFGCHEGLYSIELARQGATVVGIEGRQVHLDKAEFVKSELGLANLDFRCDDVRNFSREVYGTFDVALCVGILYHLDFEDGMRWLKEVCAAADMVIVDTHIGLQPEHAALFEGREYWGHVYNEPAVDERDLVDVLKNNGASIGNRTSFWLTRGSLFNALSDNGCTSVFEVGCPTVPGQFFDRVTVVGMKGRPVDVKSAPGEFERSRPRHGPTPCMDTAGQAVPRF